jgi:hypothetical protein
MLTPEEQERLHDRIAPHLDAIKRHFKAGAKITLLVRSPELPGDTSVILTDDDIEAAIAELQAKAVEVKGDAIGKALDERRARRGSSRP